MGNKNEDGGKKQPFSFAQLFPQRKEPRHAAITKDINLLPREILEQRRADKLIRQITVTFLKVFVLACLLIAVPLSMQLSLGFEKASLERKINDIAGIEDLEAEVGRARSQLKSRQELVKALGANDLVVRVVLETMEKVIPKDIYITSLSQTVNEKDAQRRQAVVLRGVSRNKESVADFQKSLKGSGLYREVFVSALTERDEFTEKFTTVTETDENGEEIERQVPLETEFAIEVDFEMNCILNEWE